MGNARMARLTWSTHHHMEVFGVKRAWWQAADVLYTPRVSRMGDAYHERVALTRLFEHAAYEPPRFRVLDDVEPMTQVSFLESVA